MSYLWQCGSQRVMLMLSNAFLYSWHIIMQIKCNWKKIIFNLNLSDKFLKTWINISIYSDQRETVILLLQVC